MLCGWCYAISIGLVFCAMGYKEWIEPMFQDTEINQIEKVNEKVAD